MKEEEAVMAASLLASAGVFAALLTLAFDFLRRRREQAALRLLLLSALSRHLRQIGEELIGDYQPDRRVVIWPIVLPPISHLVTSGVLDPRADRELIERILLLEEATTLFNFVAVATLNRLVQGAAGQSDPADAHEAICRAQAGVLRAKKGVLSYLEQHPKRASTVSLRGDYEALS